MKNEPWTDLSEKIFREYLKAAKAYEKKELLKHKKNDHATFVRRTKEEEAKFGEALTRIMALQSAKDSTSKKYLENEVLGSATSLPVPYSDTDDWIDKMLEQELEEQIMNMRDAEETEEEVLTEEEKRFKKEEMKN